MSPLNHTPGSDLVEGRIMRPAGMQDAASGEKRPLRMQDDPRIAADPKVQKLVARLETLEDARADHRVLSKVQGQIDAACIEILEKRALILKQERETREQEKKQKSRDQIAAETLHRMSGFLQCAMKIGSYQITIHLDRAMDTTARQHCVGDLSRLLAIGVRESERAAILARVGHPVTEFPKRLLAEIKDVCRRSIHHGCFEFKEI